MIGSYQTEWLSNDSQLTNVLLNFASMPNTSNFYAICDHISRKFLVMLISFKDLCKTYIQFQRLGDVHGIY